MTQTKAELLQTRHQGDIRLGDADSTHYEGFKAPATVGSSLVWTLPAVDGTANYLLKTDGSGNLGWVADSTTDSTKMPLAGGTFTGDVNFADTAQLEIATSSTSAYTLRLTDSGVANYDFVFPDTSTIKITTNTASTKQLELKNAGDGYFDFLLADSGKVKLGDSSDLQIYHNGTNNYIKPLNGDLIIDNGSAELARITQGGDIELPDNGEFRAGTGDDLKIYHDGSTNIIDAATSNAISFRRGGSEQFFIGNAEFKGGDDKKIKLGTGDDLQIYHDGTDSFITSATGTLKVTGGISQAATAVGALQLDLSTSNYFTKTISGNSTFTFANPAASGTVTAFTLELTHSSGTVTWPSEVKWNADTAPTLTTGKTHLFMFVTDDAGSRYRGSALVDYVN